MCTRKCYGEERAPTFLRLRVLIAKLRKLFSVFAAARELERPAAIPDDVKEGHFAVLAVKGSEKKRFVVEIECLNSPVFLRLLEQAEEEYGFEQTGALVVPCGPEELQKILERLGGDKRLDLSN